ncbi:hypothetical protein [Curtobacterium oceanosedimentum]|uniref:hypothetical protein n=1 Tax=Curtobacterium oceanosedimentum TaxID=465820 RepID=UPI001CE15AE4|nr:hypothetical protein [Curtobacterium oceanosedimentum]MCA5922555.1 hypothetical protein [Curtobacterium oceanosedimentum]
MTRHPAVSSAIGAIIALALTACAGGQPMTATPTASSGSDQADARAAAEERAGAVQRTIADTFDAEKVSSAMNRKWVLLACPDSEVQSAGGITLRLTESETVDPAYGRIRSEFSADPSFTAETNRTGRGLERLALSRGTGERYLVTVDNESLTVRIASFSPCYRGSLSDR